MNRPESPSQTKEPHGEPRRADGAREKRVSSCEGLLEEILEKLVVNRTKSRVCELHNATSLGFTVVRNRIRWSEESAGRFKSRLHEITKRTRGVSPTQVMEELQRFVRGAVNYYALGMPHREARELDEVDAKTSATLLLETVGTPPDPKTQPTQPRYKPG